MDFNKLRQIKRENWTVWVTLNDKEESIKPEYIPVSKEPVSYKKQQEIIESYLKQKYGPGGWLAYCIDEFPRGITGQIN